MSRKAIIKELILVAEVFGVSLTKSRIETYLAVLGELSELEMKRAVSEVLNDPSIKFFPLPAVFLQKAKPKATDEDKAKEAAARIVSAVSRFGYPFSEDARKYIGEIGWRVVELQGGWSTLCQNMRNSMIPTLQA